MKGTPPKIHDPSLRSQEMLIDPPIDSRNTHWWVRWDLSDLPMEVAVRFFLVLLDFLD